MRAYPFPFVFFLLWNLVCTLDIFNYSHEFFSEFQDHKKVDPVITLFSLIALEKFAQISKYALYTFQKWKRLITFYY